MNKVLFVSNRLIGGGSERVLVSLANEFANKNKNVSIISFRDGDTYPINSGIKVFVIDECKNKLKKILKIREIIKKEKPDTVIAFEYFVNMQAILASLGTNAKVVVSERNDPAKEGGSFPNSLIRNIIYCFCDRLICQTEDAKNYFPGVIKKKTSIILNPIKNDLPKRWEGERSNRIVSFCRLEKQKNLNLLVDAFCLFSEEFPYYELHIYGNGNERDNIIKYIDTKSVKDRIFIHPSEANIHEVVLKDKMFVLTSDYEGLSNSMLEAMAIGLPVICTDCPVGGARMVIKSHENGILVPVGDVDAVFRAMKEVASSDNLAEAISIKGVMLRDELELSYIADQWISEIDS